MNRFVSLLFSFVVAITAHAQTPEHILADYPDLEPDDLRACLAYAHAVIAHDKLDAVQIGN